MDAQDLPPLRIGVLVAGYPRKPFTVPVDSRTSATIGDHIIVSNIGEQLSGFHKPFVLGGMPTTSVECDLFAYMRFFLATTHGVATHRRFLRISDPLCRQLMDPLQMRDALPSVTEDQAPIDRSARIVPLLAAVTEDDGATWIPDADEIHIIAVLYRQKRVFDNDRMREERVCDAVNFNSSHSFDRESDAPRLNIDASFHKKSFSSLRMLKLKILIDPPGREGPSLPTGECMLSIKHARCLSDRSPPRPSTGHIPRLATLAGDTYLHAMIHSIPPPYLDPLDCIVTARIVTWRREVLMDNIVCYLKFLPPALGLPIAGKEKERAVATQSELWKRPRWERERDWTKLDDYFDDPQAQAFVNREMLELVDWVAQAAEPDQRQPRMRMLVLVSKGPAHRVNVDDPCWPTNILTLHASRYYR